jgi:hypothetical protein
MLCRGLPWEAEVLACSLGVAIHKTTVFARSGDGSADDVWRPTDLVDCEGLIDDDTSISDGLGACPPRTRPRTLIYAPLSCVACASSAAVAPVAPRPLCGRRVVSLRLAV